MTSSGTHREVPWDLSFLRVGAAVTAALTAVAAPVAGLIGGWDDALAVLLGAAVVTVFFALSGLVIAWAGRHGDAFTLPAAMGSFLVKIVVLAMVLQSLPADGWLDRRTFAWVVVAGALLWSVVQQRWVWTRRLYYVQPPAPPTSGGISTPPGEAATRG
jgi:asparagine N-glycosylation enzyme membrane subunit Stt3